MSDQPDLNNLSIKDLRQLAGEHQIQNRSRLSKDDLINALKGVLTGHLVATSAKAAKAAAEKSAATNANEETVTKASSVEKENENPAEQAAAEPELLDAAAVAELTNNAANAHDESEDDDAEEDSDDADGITENDPDGRPRRRRRRRRGRGRGRRDGPASSADGASLTEEAPQNDPAEKNNDAPVPAPAVVATEKPAPVVKAPAPPAVSTSPAVRPAVPPRSESQPVRPPTPTTQSTADQRAPRPRLEGLQRPLPSVLDRLCSFSKGILELCDPSTPTWAQARLSELLAEIGVGPCPAQGVPHSEFHQVVGTIVAKNVPFGHIALVEAPGFIMRGDRGDLFSLRKAVVRVAGNERSDGVPASLATVATSQRTPVSTHQVPVQNNGTTTKSTPPSLVTAQPESRRPAQVAPNRGRSPLKTHGMEPVGEAPSLPLAQQDPVALAAREKSPGFSKLGLNDQILADLAAIGYNEPSPIQEQSIPVILTGKDILGQAQTGTGKTAAFVLPILQKLYSVESPERKPVALILCPTRELARQVYNEFNRMAGASGARAAVIYGGTPMDDQVRALESFPHVIIGTPGRIIDHMKRRALDLSGLQTLVLDEADQMLDIGFWPDVNYILGHTPPTRQVLLFSATFPDEVKEMAQKHMKEPESIRITPKVITVEQVDQKYIPVARERKNALLAHFIETQNPPQLVVFCRTKHQTDRVAEVLKKKNMSAGAIHGDLPQTKRERILAAFRSGEIQSLIATNVAARGLDIPTVSHVVNYDIPEMPEEYVHRIGRTARNGAKGIARTFITPEDGQFLLEIEKHIGLLLEEEKIEGFEATPAEPEVKRTIAEMPVGQPRILKPLVGGIRLGRRRR